MCTVGPQPSLKRSTNGRLPSSNGGDRYLLQDLSAAVEQAIAPGPDTDKILIYPGG
jgi:hypothetical protein